MFMVLVEVFIFLRSQHVQAHNFQTSTAWKRVNSPSRFAQNTALLEGVWMEFTLLDGSLAKNFSGCFAQEKDDCPVVEQPENEEPENTYKYGYPLVN
jgi:hypothetical protein